MEKNKLQKFLKALSKEQLENIIFKNYEYIVDEYERHKRDVKGFEEAKMDICLKTAKENMNDFKLMLKYLNNLITKEVK